MKKLSLITACILVLLTGCTTAQFDDCHSCDSSSEPRLSIEDAKAAFEETYSVALTKTGNTKKHRNKLSPGEFTPLWDNAAYSENSRACSYDVKLITERRVYAIVAEFRNGRSVAEKVRVHQRLVTINNESYPRTCCNLLSPIPDYGCDGGDRIDVLSLVSAGLQVGAMVTARIPIPHAYIVSGALGITSAVVGLVSVFISDGMYIMKAPNGEFIYIYISSNSINIA